MTTECAQLSPCERERDGMGRQAGGRGAGTKMLNNNKEKAI